MKNRNVVLMMAVLIVTLVASCGGGAGDGSSIDDNPNPGESPADDVTGEQVGINGVLTIGGRVVDHNGAAVAGATVYIPSYSENAGSSTLAEAPSGTCAEPVEPACASTCTDDVGAFALDVEGCGDSSTAVIIRYEDFQFTAMLNCSSAESCDLGWVLLDMQKPPVIRLLHLSLSPPWVDTTDGPQEITFTAQIAHDSACQGDGYIASDIRFISPTEIQDDYVSFREVDLVSGDACNGIYEKTMNVHRYAESGTWTLAHVSLSDGLDGSDSLDADEVSEIVGSPLSFTKSGPEDVMPPQLLDVELSTTSVDTSTEEQMIFVTARIVDDLAGYGELDSHADAFFASPSETQHVSASFRTGDRIAGNEFDGIYLTYMTVPHGAEQGTWTLVSFHLMDKARNRQSLRVDDIAALMGYDVVFEQTGN